MTTIDPTPEQFKTLMIQIPDNTPIFMINFLKYKSIVAETGKTGKETYELYSQKAHPFVLGVGAKIVWVGDPQMYFIGHSEDIAWDKILIVEYPSKQAFVEMIKNPDYPSAIRTSALEDSKLIVSLVKK